MRDSTIVYRSFYEAIKTLPNLTDQAKLWNAIMEYSLNFKEVKLEGVPKSLFMLMKPNIDTLVTNWKNGNKPKKRKGSEEEAEDKREISEEEAVQEANEEPELSEEEAYKDKDKDKEDDKDLDKEEDLNKDKDKDKNNNIIKKGKITFIEPNSNYKFSSRSDELFNSIDKEYIPKQEKSDLRVPLEDILNTKYDEEALLDA
jgi:hypothetical protein